MFLTNVLCKTAKSKCVMIFLRSTGSTHGIVSFKEKGDPKKEIIFFDPYIDMDCVYKEEKKIRTMKRPLKISKQKNEHTYGIIPEELKYLENEITSKNTKGEKI